MFISKQAAERLKKLNAQQEPCSLPLSNKVAVPLKDQKGYVLMPRSTIEKIQQHIAQKGKAQ